MNKRFRQLLAALLCAAALCMAVPAALAAQPLDESENGKVVIYFDACGGVGIPIVERTNGDGKLSSLPTPTMEGYTFNGWFTDFVGGSQIKVNETVFGADTTIYAQWSPIDQPYTEPESPADTAEGIWERHKATILITGGVLALLAMGLVM